MSSTVETKTDRHSAPVTLACRTLFVRSWKSSFWFVTAVVIVPATLPRLNLDSEAVVCSSVGFMLSTYVHCAVCA